MMDFKNMVSQSKNGKLYVFQNMVSQSLYGFH